MILIPFIIVLVALAIIFVLFERNRLNTEVDRTLLKTASTFDKLISFRIKNDIEIMQTAIFPITRDKGIIKALTQKSPDELAEICFPIFNNLKEKYGVSHFYFHGADKVNLIRLHDVSHSGDLIQRDSLARADKEKNISVGVEQGPTGASVLRVVSPMFDGPNVIGFVELGKEFQDIVEEVETFIGIKALLVVPKSQVKRTMWENRNNKSKYKAKWDFFPDHVIMASSISEIPDEMSKLSIKEDSKGYLAEKFDLRNHEYHYKAIIIPYKLEGGTKASFIILLHDVKALYSELQRTFFIVLLFIVLLVFVFCTYLFRFLGNVDKLIINQQETLVAKSRMASLGEMAGGMAHEINNPLTVIQLLTRQSQKLLSSPRESVETLKENLEKILTHSFRIEKVVIGLMEFSGKSKGVDIGHHSVKKAIEDAFFLCREKFKHLKIDIRCDEVDDKIQFHGTLPEITQVIYNVLSNAYDAVESIEEKWIKLEVVCIPGFIEIIITDSGVGVKKEIRDMIFNPFFTTKEIGKGTGLGLSLSLGILKKHGGDLILDKDSPHTRFIIKIPVYENA